MDFDKKDDDILLLLPQHLTQQFVRYFTKIKIAVRECTLSMQEGGLESFKKFSKKNL